MNEDTPATAAHLVLPLPRHAGPMRPARYQAKAGDSAGGALSMEQLSDLLWAGLGLDRRGSGGRSPVPRSGWRGTEVYVCVPGGCYRYDPREHALTRVGPADHRPMAGWMARGEPPTLGLVYVEDAAAGDEVDGEEAGRLAGAEAHAMAAGMAACCARVGYTARNDLPSSPRLRALLGLRAPRRIVLTQAIAAPSALH